MNISSPHTVIPIPINRLISFLSVAFVHYFGYTVLAWPSIRSLLFPTLPPHHVPLPPLRCNPFSLYPMLMTPHTLFHYLSERTRRYSLHLIRSNGFILWDQLLLWAAWRVEIRPDNLFWGSGSRSSGQIQCRWGILRFWVWDEEGERWCCSRISASEVSGRGL